MAVLGVETFKPTSNELLLDLIRDDASPDYQARIPEATKAGLQATMAALQNWRPSQNEFIDALVNKVALTIMKTSSWTNPLAEFKRGMLTGGDTIEEIMVGLVKAKTYDPARDALEGELFGTAPIEVQTNFHKRNRQDKYKVTVNQNLLKAAFTREQGLSAFAAQIMNAPGTSDQWDEFLLMCQLFTEYEANGGYFKVKIRDITNPESPTLAADTKSVLTQIRSMVGTLKFISRQYNAAHMQISAQPDELVLFVSPEVNAVLDVEALAGAFNVEKMELSGRIIEIPRDKFPAGIEILLTTRDFFVVADSVFETASQWNPASLQTNYWLHRWQTISASRFVPAIAFSTIAGDEVVKVQSKVVSVTAITTLDKDGATVTDVKRGGVYQLNAAAVVESGDVNAANTGVRYSLTGNTSPMTYVSQTGVLHVGGNEGGDSLTVTATSTWLDPENVMRNGETSTATLTVSGDVVLVLWPNTDNPATAADDADHVVTGITVKGVELTPAFDPAVFTYTVTVPGGSAAKSDVVVTADGIDAGDIAVSTTNAGKTVKVEAATAAGDPVYTITVS